MNRFYRSISHNSCLRGSAKLWRLNQWQHKIPQNCLKLARICIFTKSAISWNCNISVASERIIMPLARKIYPMKGNGRPPSWKYINRCISAISGLICTRFSLQIDIRHTRVTGSQITLLKIQDGGGRHLEVSIFGHILVVNEDIFIKFGTPIVLVIQGLL